MDRTNMPHDIFVSHVEEDAGVAIEIAQALEQAGLTTWYYERDCLPGPQYLLQVPVAIDESKIIVVVISPHSLGSNQVTSEIVRAYEVGKSFVPLLLGITHAEFQQRQPVWRQALGASTSLSLPTTGIASVFPCIIAGVRALLATSVGTSSTIAQETNLINKSIESQSGLLRLRHSFQVKKRKPVSLATLSNPDRVAVALSDHSLELWDINDGRRLQRLTEDCNYPSNWGFNDFTVSQDGRYAAVSWDSELCEVWDMKNGEYIEINPHKYQVFSAVVVSDGQKLLSVGDEAGIVGIWDIKKNKSIDKIKVAKNYGSWLRRLVVLPGESTLLFAGWKNCIGLWNIESNTLISKLSGHSGPVDCLAIDSVGRHAISGSADETVRVWNLSNGVNEHILKGHSSKILSVDISPDGKIAASVDEEGILKIWQVTDGTCFGSNKTISREIRFASFGKQLILAENDIQVYDIKMGSNC